MKLTDIMADSLARAHQRVLGPDAVRLARCCQSAVGKVVVEVVVEAQQKPPSKEAGTNCLAWLVLEALVVMGALEAGHEAEILHGPTSSCPRLRGSQSPQCPEGSIPSKCLL